MDNNFYIPCCSNNIFHCTSYQKKEANGFVEIQRGLMAIKKRGINPQILALLFSVEEKVIGTVTDFQYPVIFPSEFSVLFPKISEYLRADLHCTQIL